MNRLLLSLTLLFSIPAFAVISHEEAQRQLATAQQRIKDIQGRMHALESKANGTLKAIQSVNGKEEFGKDIAQRSALIQSRVTTREQLRAELDQAFTERQRVLTEVGRRFPVSVNSNGEYTVNPRENPLPASQSSRYTQTSTIR